MARDQQDLVRSIPTKLARPSVAGTKIQKRPLIHPPIASPRTGASTQKIVFINAQSSFIVAVKRVRKFLAAIEARSSLPIPTGSLCSARDNLDDKRVLEMIGRTGAGRHEEVLVKGTGRAIEKALEIALFFQGQDDVKMVMRTGCVGAVDDLIAEDGSEESQVRRVNFVEVAVSLR